MARRPGHLALARLVPVALVGLCALPGAGTSAAGAAQLDQPASAPYQVTLDVGSHPAPFTISVSGFAPNQQVFVEQCDGLSPSTPNWDPAIDCDSGSAPAPVVVSADGRAVFASDDRNHRFTPFVGTSPQEQFSCLPAGAATGGGTAGVPSYTNCQVRVSTNNATATTDQVMFSLVLPAGATPPPAAPPPSSGPNGVTTSTAARGATPTPAGGGRSATARATHRSTTTVRRARGNGAVTDARRGGRRSSGGSDGSSARSVGWVIAGIVAVSGAGGYLWAWRRKRLSNRV